MSFANFRKWLARLDEWPPRTWSGFIFHLCAVRGMFTAWEWYYGKDIPHGWALLASFAIIGVLTIFWPRDE